VAPFPTARKYQQEFSEMNRAEFFDLATARKKIKARQVALIEELEVKPAKDLAARSKRVTPEKRQTPPLLKRGLLEGG
jgi:predicted NUDIX family NTP pyrophosphohydrolase